MRPSDGEQVITALGEKSEGRRDWTMASGLKMGERLDFFLLIAIPNSVSVIASLLCRRTPDAIHLHKPIQIFVAVLKGDLPWVSPGHNRNWNQIPITAANVIVDTKPMRRKILSQQRRANVVCGLQTISLPLSGRDHIPYRNSFMAQTPLFIHDYVSPQDTTILLFPRQTLISMACFCFLLSFFCSLAIRIFILPQERCLHDQLLLTECLNRVPDLLLGGLFEERERGFFSDLRSGILKEFLFVRDIQTSFWSFI